MVVADNVIMVGTLPHRKTYITAHTCLITVHDPWHRRGGIYAAPTVPRIMNSYKASVSRDIGFPVWQRSYHDHIIRDHHDFEEIWKYIANNPTQWVLDGKA